MEWRPEDVSDAVLLAVLQRAYDMFHLFQVGTFTIFWPQHILDGIKHRVNCLRLKPHEVMREFVKQRTTFSHDTSLPCDSRGQVILILQLLDQNGPICHHHLRIAGAVGWSPLPALDSPAVPQSANLGHSNPGCSSLRPLGPLPPGRIVHNGKT